MCEVRKRVSALAIDDSWGCLLKRISQGFVPEGNVFML